MYSPLPACPPPRHPAPQLRCRRFLALPKTSLYWMSPRWGSTAEQLPVSAGAGCHVGRKELGALRLMAC